MALNRRKTVSHSTVIHYSSKFKLKTSRVVLKNVIFQSCPLILKKSVDPRVMICSVLGLETKKSKYNVEEMCLFAIKVNCFWLQWNFETCCKFSIKMMECCHYVKMIKGTVKIELAVVVCKLLLT